MKLRYIIVVLVVIAFLTWMFFWNEARKEVYYLCGNFSAGVSKESVLRQLDTANLSDYQLGADKIIFSSPLNLRLNKCVILLDEKNQVLEAYFEG